MQLQDLPIATCVRCPFAVSVPMSAYLSFELDRLTYALPATAVREVFPLPELVPIAEAPGDIIGLLNLRGRIVPMMHLAKRLGRALPPCHPDNRAIVLEWDGLVLGVVVDAVRDVIELAPEAIAAEPDYGRVGEVHTAFVGGVAQVGETLTVVLDPQTLIRDASSVAVLAAAEPEEIEAAAESLAPTDFYARHFPEATAAQRQTLRDRASALRSSLGRAAGDGRDILLAAFNLEGELFGIDVRYVREFIRLPEVVPIPCCPAHILGNANLRGDILTLVDIRSALGLPAANRAGLTQVMAIETGDLVAGILTGEVFDIFSLPADAVREAPTAGRAHLQGMAQYGDRPLGIIDLPELLARGGLIVNETIA